MGHEGRRGGAGQDQSSAALAFRSVLECGGSTPLCLSISVLAPAIWCVVHPEGQRRTARRRFAKFASEKPNRRRPHPFKNQRRKGGAPENRLAGRSVLHPPLQHVYPGHANNAPLLVTATVHATPTP